MKVTVGDESLSAAELERAAGLHAATLRARGIGPGARVGVVAQPRMATVVAMVGNLRAGVVTVPINPALGQRELEHVRRDAAPVAILGAEPVPFAEPLVTTASAPEAPRVMAGDAPALILYTSGTTGLPKGAVLTHGNIGSNLDALAQAWGWTSADTLVHALPLFHVHGLVLGVFGPLRVGSALRVLPRFSPAGLAAAFDDGATMLFAVPTMYHRIAEELEAEPALRPSFARARLLVSGSAALPAREHQRMFALTGQRVVERYGLTETLINCAVRHDGDRRPGIVGPPLPGVTLKLVGDDGKPAAAGEIAEVVVRGPNVFAGYLNRTDSSDGSFRTGDLAVLEADGALRIMGRRATDLIKTGGYKVGAGEVEAALLEHPAVREAAVVGRPDEDLGERIVAYVVLREPVSADELIQHVARLASPHKRPREVHVLPELPRNAMGKVSKKALG